MSETLAESWDRWISHNPDGLNSPIFTFEIPPGITPLTFIEWFINHINTCELMNDPRNITDIINKIRMYVLNREYWVSKNAEGPDTNKYKAEIAFALSVIQYLIDDPRRYQNFITGLEQSYSRTEESRVDAWHAFAKKHQLTPPTISQ